VLGLIGLADVRRLLRDPAQAVAPKPRMQLRDHPAYLASQAATARASRSASSAQLVQSATAAA
jgi:hypothetical protein